MGVQFEIRALVHLAILLTCIPLTEGMINVIDTVDHGGWGPQRSPLGA